MSIYWSLHHSRKLPTSQLVYGSTQGSQKQTQSIKAPEQQIEIINTIASEQLDRARRKNRLIVFGLTSSKS